MELRPQLRTQVELREVENSRCPNMPGSVVPVSGMTTSSRRVRKNRPRRADWVHTHQWNAASLHQIAHLRIGEGEGPRLATPPRR